MYFYNQKPIRLIELFAGIGSQAKALKNLGVDFEHWYVCEFDKNAIQSYNAVHNTNFTASDVTKITADDLRITDTEHFTYLLTYSFPCQDLSSAGKGRGMEKGSGTRSGLLWEVERLLNECTELPQVLLMENVPQVHSAKNHEHFGKWIKFLESKGYSNSWCDLNAKDYGIPQNRNRCYMVSVLGNHSYEFPQPVSLTLKFGDMLEKEVDEKYYLPAEQVERLVTIPKDKHGPSLLDKSSVCAKTITTRIHNSGNYEQYIVEKVNINELKIWDGFNQRVRADNDCCGTITTNIGADLKRNGQGVISYIDNELWLRKFTPKECWRLMGFDDEDFHKAEKVCSHSQLYKQAGNSIVVNVLMAIFRELFMPKKTRSQWLDELLKF